MYGSTGSFECRKQPEIAIVNYTYPRAHIKMCAVYSNLGDATTALEHGDEEWLLFGI